MSDFARHLAGLIRHEGPMRLDRFMGLANAHYYATRDPLGTRGDFTTAPEISQLFGELIGLAMVDHWQRAGSPDAIHLVELGPGRGTLMADLLRAAAIRPAFVDAAAITLVETSPALRRRQAETLAGHNIAWADDLAEIPDDAPLYLVANEFFDALPIRQFRHDGAQWLERHVTLSGENLIYADIPAPFSLSSLTADVSPGDRTCIAETNEPTRAIAADIGMRLAARDGLALVIDYGYAEGHGDTFQALKDHSFTDPLQAPGEADLTAHVDFAALARAASPARIYGPVTQGALLAALGLEARANALIRARPDSVETVIAGATRLTDPAQMGTLFKALALTGPGGPAPAGFPP